MRFNIHKTTAFISKLIKYPMKRENRMHENMKYILLFSQIFGCIPVHGILSQNASHLRYVWNSKRVLYSCFWSVLLFITSLQAVVNLFVNDIRLRHIGK